MEHKAYIFTFLAIILCSVGLALTADPKRVSRMTVVSCFASAAFGLLIYGYGYFSIGEDPVSAVARTVFSVCRMFLGDSDYSEISTVAFFEHRAVKIIFWIVHLMAFYSTVSAAVSVMGAKVLKKLALRFGTHQEVAIIFGVNQDSLEFGRELDQIKGKRVVFVSKGSADPAIYTAAESDIPLYFDSSAVNGTAKFLHSIGAGKKRKKISLYALSKDPDENILYARNILSSLEQNACAPEKTSLIILASEDSSVLALQNTADTYGFGFVTVFQEHSLVSRLLIRQYPPCDHVAFDRDGKAKKDFHVVMIGFGQIGKENLKQLIMNGQFEGSRFRASVFAPDLKEQFGHLLKQCSGIFDNYDISFFPHDGRSVQLYDHISDHRSSIDYVVINTGSEKLNTEIGKEVSDYLSHLGNHSPVILCSYQGIRMIGGGSSLSRTTGIYSADILSTAELDATAMLLNQQYLGGPDSEALQNWMKCDYFSRMSCRAATDFFPAYLRAAGTTKEAVLSDGWDLTPEQLENMSKTEHLRWCAFHYCMGFLPMGAEEYDRREELYRSQKANGIKPLVRVGKNMADRTHACLIGWDELDALSERETRVTGKTVDYKKNDTDNILMVPHLLRAEESSAISKK